MTVDREQLIQAMDQAGLTDEAWRESYSGRGMYGRGCFGIVCSPSDFALFCASVGSFMDDWDWVGHVRSDSMGHDTIWYFPGVEVTS